MRNVASVDEISTSRNFTAHLQNLSEIDVVPFRTQKDPQRNDVDLQQDRVPAEVVLDQQASHGGFSVQKVDLSKS